VIDRRRFRRLRRFFAGAFLHVFWCDVVLRLPILRLLRTDPIRRWSRIAARFRALAVELGGVMIKLGQYLSVRIDLLPPEVIRELAGLQDEVPAADFDAVARQVEEDFGRPLGEVFAHVEPEPVGAASLAQVHRARLPDGRSVVVKVLRPGIEVLVETDLAALGRAVRWLRWWRFVRTRVDLDWVLEELATTTRRELDMVSEGRYAERFAENFAGDPDVHLPEIHWEYSAPRTLTEEDVAFLKVTDRSAMEAAGIDPGEVARKLFGIYMRQIFVHNLVHADPHPGNLFVRPLPEEGRFQVVFVDFGMVAEIPPRVRRALRHFLIGMGSRDAGMVVDALRDAGYLLPGADLAQLEEVLEAAFERFWGVELGRLNRLAMSEAVPLLREFGELLLETPVQIQADLMYAGRAVELLSALATDLDDTLNPWAEAVPFAEALAAEATERGFREQAVRFLDALRRLAELPWRASRVLDLAQRGRLTVRAALAPDARRELRRLGRAVDHLAVSVLAAALVVAGALVYRPEAPWPTVALAATGIALFLGSRWLR